MAENNIPKIAVPNKALEPLKPFIGAWRAAGSHALIPGVELHGRTTFEWHESGAFIIMRSTVVEDVGVPTGVAIFGSDDVLGTFAMIYFDERGVSREYHASMEGNVLKWWRDAPDISQRYALTISADQQTIDSKGEISKDGGSTWGPDLQLTCTRIKT